MPVSFCRLRIVGFKSFAEPVTLEIMPGLTGLVGPNGCGKSNVVEALRWAMGENSARSLRGGEMEDVIFAGSGARPSRNIAEVSVTLDEVEGRAPPPFGDHPEIEISRRIERGQGSAFRVNGREVRARDIQTLLADLATGAHSSALVSQGRVGALVTARPESRRSILEEAAGITGLHARRHEAELKLRAAEANLTRAQDLGGQLGQQLEALKRQARQASRYRNLSGAVRQAEAELLGLERARVGGARQSAARTLLDAGAATAAASIAATRATTEATETAAAVPPLREAEAHGRTELERHRIGQEQLAAEEQRVLAALDSAARRLAQIGRDLSHAEQQRDDGADSLARLAAEETTLAAAESGAAATAEAASAAVAAGSQAVGETEAEANRATEAVAQAGARHLSVAERLKEERRRSQRLAADIARLTQERDRVAALAVPTDRLAEAEREAAAGAAAAEATRARLETAEQARIAAQAASAACRDRQSTALSARSRLAAEAEALAEVLAVRDGETWPAMVDTLTVPAGLEAALGAALGEELSSAADPSAARHWRELPPWTSPPDLPEGTTPFTAATEAPAALARALSQIGLVADEVAGEAWQARLAPGQTLVSRAGAVWRWDGYTIRAGTPTAAAVRLQQRNRLTQLREQLHEAERAAALASSARAEADAAETAANAAAKEAGAARADAERRAERGRLAFAQLQAKAAETAARLHATQTQLGRLEAEAEAADTALARLVEAEAALPDLDRLRAGLAEARARLSAARAQEQEARATRDTLARERQARADRRLALSAERQKWTERARDAQARIADLAARRAEAAAEHAGLAAAPAEAAGRRREAVEGLDRAETAHARAATALATAEAARQAADRAWRGTEVALAAAREAEIRAEAEAAHAEQDWLVLAARIAERLGSAPSLPEPPAEIGPEAEAKARRRLDRLVKEREEMGPVNLRAELEAQAVEARLGELAAERDELATAIAKLRGSIGHLNREGRDRLNAMFQSVDRHFQALFARMFGGGRAHLAMVGSDDPLEAGLEIYAQPPGKKLATLSLLSGGEQALTALSLIFAVFRCNPAPICVLDEVDAPLDDANVERFCNLLDDMVRETETRFIVVTHHHLTMARMDRLYGVTMQERGVSRVLSVDLRTAAGFAAPHDLAAE